MLFIPQPFQVPFAGPVYDATGPGNYTANSVASPDTFSETHTFGSSSANLILAWLAWQTASTTTISAVTRAVTVGGESMTSAGVMGSDNFTNPDFVMILEGFYLLSPPVSPLAQTVQATITESSITFQGIINTVSYSGVTSVGSAVLNYGASTALTSNAVSSATGHLVAQCFLTNNSDTFSLYTGTQRFTSTSSGLYTILAGDTPGAASTTLTATLSPSDGWASIALDLV
jgi:hypothetical protein